MLRKLILSSLALIFGLGGIATAQDPQQPKSPDPGVATRRQRMPREPRGPRGLRNMRQRRLAVGRQLNLTDDQKKLGKEIQQKYFANTKGQREQLFQLREKRLAGTFTDADRELARSVRREMMTAMRAMREESLGVLTAEQRSQLDNMREQRKQRREEMRQRRQERRQTRPPLE